MIATEPDAPPAGDHTEHADHPVARTGVPRVSKTAAILVPLALLVVLGGGAAVALLAGVIPARRDQKELEQRTAEQLAKPPRVIAAVAIAAPENLTFSLPARLEAKAEAPLFPRESGYLKSVLVDIGDRVTAGQTLAIVETPVLDQELRVADANIHTAEARVAETEAQYTIAKAMLDRLEAVKDGRAISPQDLDDARGRTQAAFAARQAAKAALEAARSDQTRLSERKALANIIAPFDGEISQRGYDVGALVIADKTDTSRPIFTLTDRSEIRAFVDLPQAAAVQVKTGEEIELRVRELAGKVFKGQIVRASAAITASTRTRLVESRIPNPDRLLLSGMFADVRLSIPRDPRPTLVPGEAIIIRSARPHIAVIAGGGRISYREVTIGRDTGETVEILTGLKPGERVAVSLARQPAEGTVVEAIERTVK